MRDIKRSLSLLLYACMMYVRFSSSAAAGITGTGRLQEKEKERTP